MEDADNDTALTESDRAGGSAAARDAITALKVLAHDGYNGIEALPSFSISRGEKLEVFTAYGWSAGHLGIFSDARTIGLCRLAVSGDVELDKPEWAYSAALQAEIIKQLALYDANADDRTAGERMSATKIRNEAQDLFETSLSRVWHFLCSATDDIDQWPELRRYGFNVRKNRSTSKKMVAPASPS